MTPGGNRLRIRALAVLAASMALGLAAPSATVAKPKHNGRCHKGKAQGKGHHKRCRHKGSLY
jgi:hypothetical protein